MRVIKFYIDDPQTGGQAPVPLLTPPPTAAVTPALPATAPVAAPPGGGDPNAPAAPAAPKGYTATTPQQRSDWNGFLDFAAKQNGVNLSDPKQQTAMLAAYKKTNPNFSITADQIPNIQYESYQLRKGNAFGNLGEKELGYIRQGLNPNFVNADLSNVGKLYYPQEAGFGTDIEGYYKSKFNSSSIPVAATSPPGQKVSSVTPPVVKQPVTGITPTRSPFSNPAYAQHDSALARVNELAKIPGNEFIHGRGDAMINASYVPEGDNLSFRDSSLKATKNLGLDPNMFWASAAEEGATGFVPDKKGEIHTDPDIDVNSKYGVSGFANFGVDHFHDDFHELVRRGYLPKDFDYQKSVHYNERNEKVNSGNFKTVEDALQAKAAYIRKHQDDLDQWSKTNNLTLSPAARKFFTYISYNGGPGTAHTLINYYKKNGLMDGDKFLTQKPPYELDQSDSYGKVMPRWKMAELMKQEKLFE